MAQPFCSQGRLGLLWKWCKNGRYNHELFQQSAKVYEASPTSQTYVAEWTVSGARKTCHFSLCSIYVPIIIWFSLHGIWHHDSWSMINIYIFCTSFQSRRSRQNNSLSLSLSLEADCKSSPTGTLGQWKLYCLLLFIWSVGCWLRLLHP